MLMCVSEGAICLEIVSIELARRLEAGSPHVNSIGALALNGVGDSVSFYHTGRRVEAVIHCNCLFFSLPAQLQQKSLPGDCLVKNE